MEISVENWSEAEISEAKAIHNFATSFVVDPEVVKDLYKNTI